MWKSWQIGGNRVFEFKSFDAKLALEKGGKGLGSGSLEAELGSMVLLVGREDTLPMLVMDFMWQAINTFHLRISVIKFSRTCFPSWIDLISMKKLGDVVGDRLSTNIAVYI